MTPACSPRAGTPGGRRALFGICALSLALVGGACGPARQIELPAPDSGRFLSLEEQRALSPGQLTQYCALLDDHLARLRAEIEQFRAMKDSLGVVLESLNVELSSTNNETRLLEDQLRRLKARRKATTEYIVREGDTLMKLSGLFYGTPQEWRRIYEANEAAIADPGGPLPPGTKLTIPQ